MSQILRVASRNAGKLRELRELLEPHGYEVHGLDDLRDLDLVEDGDTFEANAMRKAQTVMHATGAAALADDSGLQVDALDGAPGIHSARFSGASGADVDAHNRAHLLRLLDGVTDQRRSARFVCVLAYCRPGESPRFYRGELEGHITRRERGTNGFGYDPIFQLSDGRTLAELSSPEKNAISHRGRALAAFVRDLPRL